MTVMIPTQNMFKTLQKLTFFVDKNVYDAVLFSDTRTDLNHFKIKIVPCIKELGCSR